MTETQHPAAWHPDPSRRHEQRYWDGVQWSEHVSTNGEQSIDEHGQVMANNGEVQHATGLIDGEMFASPTQESVQNQIMRVQEKGIESIPDALEKLPEMGATPTQSSASTSIFDQYVLVVNQKAKLMELSSEFRIFDQNAVQIGLVRQVGQSAAKKVARALLNVDSMMTHTLDIEDMNGNVVLKITKPRALLKPKVIVEREGVVLGELAFKLRIGKPQIKLIVDDKQVGMIYAENFRAWDFRIVNEQEKQIASISKTWEGFAKAIFTTADNYVVQIHEKLEDPFHSLVLASSLAVDLILKQNDGGKLF